MAIVSLVGDYRFLSQKRVGELKDKVLPHFYIRRDKSLIAHEVSNHGTPG